MKAQIAQLVDDVRAAKTWSVTGEISADRVLSRLHDILLKCVEQDLPKIFVALNQKDGTLEASVMSTAPVVVVVDLFWSRVTVTEESECEVVNLESNFSEAVFDSLGNRLQDGNMPAELLEKLSRVLENKNSK